MEVKRGDTRLKALTFLPFVLKPFLMLIPDSHPGYLILPIHGFQQEIHTTHLDISTKFDWERCGALANLVHAAMREANGRIDGVIDER